jgi:hypothetical protein
MAGSLVSACKMPEAKKRHDQKPALLQQNPGQGTHRGTEAAIHRPHHQHHHRRRQGTCARPAKASSNPAARTSLGDIVVEGSRENVSQLSRHTEALNYPRQQQHQGMFSHKGAIFQLIPDYGAILLVFERREFAFAAFYYTPQN